MVATPLGYIRQFDGIRAIAVLLVIVSHWLPGNILSKLGFGPIGVDVFFVLSGFLITRILIVERLKFSAAPLAYSRLKSIKNFMIRRSLRIFPIYYLLLLLLVIFSNYFPNQVLQDWEWYFFYLQNILFFINKAFSGCLSHLWSLAVEEQFYLFWPWLIFFIPQRWMLRLLVVLFFLGIASVKWLVPAFIGGYMSGILTPSCIQAFAAGGILAYFHLKTGSKFHQLKYHFLLPGLISFVYLMLGMNGIFPLLIDIRAIVSILIVGLISDILINPNSKLSLNLLGNSLLVFIGRISYGVYLYHNFIPELLNSLLHLLNKKNIGIFFLTYNPKLYEQSILFYFISFIILLIISLASFCFFESKIQKFKKYFT
jgi:peptidoglycan/LPS O-acetylase OafA/YrhL